MSSVENSSQPDNIWKRDLDMVRNILLRLERGESYEISLECKTDIKLANHVRLIIEAGLAHGEPTIRYDNVPEPTIGLLKWEGYELLAVLHPLDNYQKLKATVDKIGGWVLPMIQTLGSELLKEALIK